MTTILWVLVVLWIGGKFVKGFENSRAEREERMDNRFKSLEDRIDNLTEKFNG